MKILDLTFSSPADNLSCDEVLLEEAETGNGPEILRFWEPKKYFIVLGYSNAWEKEVRSEALKSKSVPVFRRSSGGGTVLQGPGCLNYSLILNIKENGDCRNIRATNEHVMERHRAAIETLTGKKIRVQGHTDLTFNDLKFSGNAQRRKRKYLLFHGTFLLDFGLSRIDAWLCLPEKQPTYRKNRNHSSFLTNLGISPANVKKTLEKTWNAKGVLDPIPRGKIKQLTEERYNKDEWNLKF